MRTELRVVAVMVGAALAASPAQALHVKSFGEAPGPVVEIDCALPSLSAAPNFRTAPAGMAEYSFRGLCKGKDQQTYVSYWVSATWTPGETDPRKANASESYNAQLNKNVWPSRSVDARGQGSVVFILGAHCNTDPWLHPATAQCTPLGDNIPDDVRAAWPALVSASFPRSREAIGNAQRTKYLADYERINPPRVAAAPRVGPAGVDAKVIEASPYATNKRASDSALLGGGRAAPGIISPAPGSTSVAGHLRVQIRMTKDRTGGNADVEFTKLDPRRQAPSPTASPSSAGSAPIVWKVATAQLAQGANVPGNAGPDATGPWLLRVRIDGGAWSQAVSFNFSTNDPSSHATSSSMSRNPAIKSALNPQPLPPAQSSISGKRDWGQATGILGK